MDHDVIVVGAGPGGSTAAYELARQGARVKLFEQKPLPRYKPCGGCLSLKIDQIMEPDFHSLSEKTVYGATFTFEGLDEFRATSERPIAYMVMRDRFDHFLAQKAQRAGVEVSPNERVLEVIESTDGVRVTTAQGEYRARYLVGADGANGIVARRLALAPKRRVAVCVEAEVETAPGASQQLRDEVRIDFGSVPFGYGWVFPKEDHLSIGVGGLRDKIQNPRSFYDEFLVDQDLIDAITSEKRKGYIIPVFAGSGVPLGSQRTLLVGDAAALVDPFLGEGIYYAVRSGQIAAETIGRTLSNHGADILHDYTEKIDAEIYREFRPARKMAFFIYAFPRSGYRVLKRREQFVERYFDVLRGDASYEDMWRDLRSIAAAEVIRALWPKSRKPQKLSEHYDHIARRYDSALTLWRTLVAAPAWDAIGRLIEEHVTDTDAVLDAGTGTGEAVRLLLERSNPESVVAVDLSKGMLHEARKKIDDPRVTWRQADIAVLPYPDRSFDVVLCTWTLETLANPRAAVSEFLRVLKDDGFVIYCFSSRSASGMDKLYARLLEEWSAGTLRGRFLAPDDRPYHDCDHSRLVTFARNLATLVVLRKCCLIDDPEGSCLPAGVDATALAASDDKD